MPYDLREQDPQAAANPHSREPSALLDHLPFRVRMVACAYGVVSTARIAARFEAEGAAEAFIRSKIANGGSGDGRDWGQNAAGIRICYWIETDQETASVKSAHEA